MFNFSDFVRLPLFIPLAILLQPLAPTNALALESGAIEGNVSATPAKFLAETVVYIEKAPARAAPVTAVLDQIGMKFTPHLLVIQVGDSVRFDNHDHVQHNVMSPDGGGYNLGNTGYGQSLVRKFTAVGAYAQLCNVHPEMQAYVFVVQNPLAVAVDANGHFKLGNLPAGPYQLAVWNPHLKAPTQAVTVTAGATTRAAIALKR